MPEAKSFHLDRSVMTFFFLHNTCLCKFAVVKIAAHIQTKNELVTDPILFPDHHVDGHTENK